MPDVFINYRSGDEETTAALIDEELSRRFGSDRIFRASKSIDPGQPYVRVLPNAVRTSKALLAVIGPRWLTARDHSGRNALDDENDWTRWEILEALELGLRVIPVLVGREMAPVRKADLPPALADLADCQYRRFDPKNTKYDLKQLGDKLAELTPGLVDHDASDAPQESSKVQNTTHGTHGSSQQTRDYTDNQSGGVKLTGNVGSFVNGPQGPVHTGKGPLINGNGVHYIRENTGGVHHHQQFGTGREEEDRG